MKERLLWLDIAKGIGIICVVIGHCTPAFMHPLYLFIYAFHMPLFYVVSGLCFNQTKYGDSPVSVFVTKRCRQLLIPLLASSLIFWIISLIPGIDYYTTKDILNGTFPRAMWFVFSLFIVETLYFFVNRWIKQKTFVIILVCVLALIIAIMFSHKGIVLPFTISSVPLGLFYYACGVMLRSYISEYNSAILSKPIKTCLTIVMLMVIVLAQTFISKNAMDMCYGIIPQNELITLFVSFCGISMVMATAILISKKEENIIVKALNYLGRNTLAILMFHLFFIELSSQYLRPLLGGIGTEPLTVWFWLLIIIPIVNRWTPWLVGKQRHNR